MKDVTEHNPEVPHSLDKNGEKLEHSSVWYKNWGGKCPVCGALPKHEETQNED